jgi:two-component system chemotaxis response regulator CheB
VSEVRVLLVDDSPTVRAVMRRILIGSGGIEVVGEAGNGLEAVEAALKLRPEAIVMDLDMPGVDGYVATERIMVQCPVPVVVVTSRVQPGQMGAAFRAIKAGAVGVFPKPEVPGQWEDLARTLPATLREVGIAHRRERRQPASCTGGDRAPGERLHTLAIGASTGGPGAICELLRELGRESALRVAVVQHIASGFEAPFADWLRHELGVDVRLARTGEVIPPGAVRIAPEGSHLCVDAGWVQRLDAATLPVRGHRPSADVLFRSLAREPARGVAGVLLTGMGSDGADGLLELRHAGGFTVTQDEASCAVFGMPRSALERGAADLALPPREIGRLLADRMEVGGC